MTNIEQLTLENAQLRQRVQELEAELQKARRGGPAAGGALPPLSAPLGGGLAAPVARPAAPLPPLSGPAATPGSASAPLSAPAGLEGGEGTDADLDEIRRQLEELTREKHEVEQRKWQIDKENIALKEQLNKLKVQGQNSQKIIEEQVEKSDRKENQNFKTRLELTDLRKGLNQARHDREKQEETNTRLHREILEVEAEVLHYKALVDLEQQRRDVIQAELNRQQDILGQYQSGFLARFYDK